MLTEPQKAWLSRLSDTTEVRIVPYDPRVKEVFTRQAAELQSILGADAIVLHKGASAWGISGKGDVDIYVPVAVEQFDEFFERLRPVLGEPGSHYHHERIRWNRQVEDIEVEIFIVNRDAEFYKDNLLFWNFVETQPDVLDQYRKIREEADGTSTREYYTRKAIFINRIIQSIKVQTANSITF
jgi:GrpB-like predicted nucleotidyltransferase (UPF0157 family)